MKKISLLTALMLTSSMVYAGWNRYEFDSTTDGYKAMPEYSCLEMICEHDCVENTDTGKGECCPEPMAGDNCVSDTKNEKGCILSSKKICPSNQYCNKSTEKCEYIPSCPDCQFFDRNQGKCVSANMNFDACYKCVNGEKQLKDPTKRFVYNGTCVECLTDANCPNGYTCDANKKCQKACVKNVDWGNSCTDSCQCKDGTGKHSGWSGVCQEGVCCFRECTICSSKAYCPQK